MVLYTLCYVLRKIYTGYQRSCDTVQSLLCTALCRKSHSMANHNAIKQAVYMQEARQFIPVVYGPWCV